MSNVEVASNLPAHSRRERWFVSAPAGVDVRPLLAALERRGVAPYVLSDEAPLGAQIVQSIQQAIATADHVLVVLGEASVSVNSVFETGLAIGLGKPVVVVADPRLRLPSDLAGLLTIRARPDDLDAIDFALDRAEGRDSTSVQSSPATGHALGARTDQLLDQVTDILKLDPAQMERTAIRVLIQAVEESGAVAVQSPESDFGFDLGVWSDDLDAIAANPLLIEIKRSFGTEAVQQAWAGLHATVSAQVALVVFLDPLSADSKGLGTARFPVLAISLPELLRRMRTASFAEVVRDLRNRSVHGLPA